MLKMFERVMQIPEHLECPDSLPEERFWNLPDDLKAFYNCARTWCAQAGVLDRHGMNNSVDSGAKHVKKLTVLLNRLLGMNLQQQQIVFGCASTHTLKHDAMDKHRSTLRSGSRC